MAPPVPPASGGRAGLIGVALALGAISAVSLGGKFATRTGTLSLDSERLAADIILRLRAGGYAYESRPSYFGHVVTARRGACRLAVRPAEPSGETDRAVKRDLAAVGPIRFAWRGVLTDQAPRWPALVAFLAAREGARLRLVDSWSPMLAVADNGRCDPALLRFTDVRGYFVVRVTR